MDENILPGMIYRLGKTAKGEPRIERRIVSIESESILADKHGIPIDPNTMPIYEIRVSDYKIGNPLNCRLIVNESSDSRKAIEIMERLNVCYTIIWQVGKKEIPILASSRRNILALPIPSLYLSNDRWFLGIKNIGLYIQLIGAIIPSGTFHLEKINEEAKKISKESKEKYGAPPGIEPGFDNGLLVETGWWIVDL